MDTCSTRFLTKKATCLKQTYDKERGNKCGNVGDYKRKRFIIKKNCSTRLKRSKDWSWFKFCSFHGKDPRVVKG